MAIDFEALKSLSASPDSLTNLVKQVQDMNKRSYDDDDDTYWYPNVDGAGNSKCTIRFLPAPQVDMEKLGAKAPPFVREYKYSFQNPANGQWYIENSLETIGQSDPVSELWSNWYRLYGKEDKRVKMLSRKLGFISNVLIIKDGMNSENNGKVKRFRYGTKIFNKLQIKMAPEIEGRQPINPFCPWTGLDLYVIIKKVRTGDKDFRNYDDSEFGDPRPLGDDKFIKEVWSQCHSLQEILDPKRFKSREDLEKRLYKVLGISGMPKAPEATSSEVMAMAAARTATEAAPANDVTENLPPWHVDKVEAKASPEAPAKDATEEENKEAKRLAWFTELANKS